jgi:DNA-binding MarR family transcriptional regulator
MSSASVDRLEELGTVERRRNKADRRSYALTITPAGRRQLGRAAKALAECAEEFLRPLSAKERDQLLRMLVRLVESD